MERVGWDEYFMRIAQLVATRSTCLRRHVGAVAVLDKRILATGYNGAVRGAEHCETTGCIRQELGIKSGERQELCRAVHAEQNVLAQAALHGISLKGGTLYCTHQPCITCAKLIIQSGIIHVVFSEQYPDDFAMKILSEGGVLCTHL